MLMVIFGAGASHDSTANLPAPGQHDYRPPLADQLFSNRSWFQDVMRRYPDCLRVVDRLRYFPGGSSLEKEMQMLQREANGYPIRLNQLAAIRFYLREMLWQLGEHWLAAAKGLTNHITLLDQIDHLRKPDELILLVTFNYDTLIEFALNRFNIVIKALPDYVSHGTFKLIKLHGSIDWAQTIQDLPSDVLQLSSDALAQKLIELAPNLRLEKSFVLVPRRQPGQCFPALAIPVEVKNEFVCPEEHLNVFIKHLPKVTKILSIGWRAQEAGFLELLKSKLPEHVEWLTVAGRNEWARDINKKLGDAGISRLFEASDYGFTEFLTQRAGAAFLRG